MKSVILYSSNIATPQTQVIHCRHKGESIPLFIRAEVKEGLDALRALEEAKPLENEIVLNTVELPNV